MAIESRPPILEVSNVVKAYGGVRAVDGASFVVPEGSLTGLIGPNGAGKSTMIEMISGFQAPNSGTIRFRGQEIQGRPAYSVSRTGLMRSFQSPREWGGLTVMENMLLAFPVNRREAVWRSLLLARPYKRIERENCARARELLDHFGLLHLRNEFAASLSGGQKRLLEFARLAAAEPRMILLDEPQAGVNPVLRVRMGELIREMVTNGTTILMVEHNLPFVEQLCDSVIVMATGKNIAVGTMRELRAHQAVIDAYLGGVEGIA